MKVNVVLEYSGVLKVRSEYGLSVTVDKETNEQFQKLLAEKMAEVRSEIAEKIERQNRCTVVLATSAN
jgi:hypothetical protein